MSVSKDVLKKSVEEVLRLIKENKRKFKQSIELIVNLRDLDLKKPENRFVEIIQLPHGSGKPAKICIIASGAIASQAKSLNVDAIIDPNELSAYAGNKRKGKELAKTYDFFLAEAPSMSLVGRYLGMFLGPRGKMPTPVALNTPLEQLVESLRKSVRVRVRSAPHVKCRVGAEDMSVDEIVDNIETVFSRIVSRLPRGLNNIASVYLKGTMTPAVKVPLGRR